MSNTGAVVTILYNGRLIALKPASLGQRYHDLCTIRRVETEQPSISNGWKLTRRDDTMHVYWYDKDPSDSIAVFCTYSGYFEAIVSDLTKLGFAINVEDRVSSKLCTPRFDLLGSVNWRPGQLEAFTSMLVCRGGLVVCPTAFGKTFLAKQLCLVYPENRIIISAPQRDIAKQMFEDLIGDIPDLGRVGDGKYDPQRVTVAVAKSLHKCYDDADLVLIDEAHSIVTKQYIKTLNRFHRAKFIGFTASPEGRGDNADGLLRAVFGERIANWEYDQAVAAGNVVPVNVRMYRVLDGPSGLDQLSSKVEADRAGIWYNDSRNALIAKTVFETLDEFGDDIQILVMVDRVEHAYALHSLLRDFPVISGPVSQKQIARLTRRGLWYAGCQACTPKLRDEYRVKFERRELLRAIATGVWNQGVDFRDLQVLVRAEGSASQIGSIQIPGRLSRLGRSIEKENGLLIDFMDKFSRRFLYRSSKRLKVYRDQKWSIDMR